MLNTLLPEMAGPLLQALLAVLPGLLQRVLPGAESGLDGITLLLELLLHAQDPGINLLPSLLLAALKPLHQLLLRGYCFMPPTLPVIPGFDS